MFDPVKRFDFCSRSRLKNIQGFTNFTAAHFVAKCHVNSSQKSHLCRLCLHSFCTYPRLMTKCEEWNKEIRLMIENIRFEILD